MKAHKGLELPFQFASWKQFFLSCFGKIIYIQEWWQRSGYWTNYLANLLCWCSVVPHNSFAPRVEPSLAFPTVTILQLLCFLTYCISEKSASHLNVSPLLTNRRADWTNSRRTAMRYCYSLDRDFFEHWAQQHFYIGHIQTQTFSFLSQVIFQ